MNHFLLLVTFVQNLLDNFMFIFLACGFEEWKGDDYCDDDNNNKACEWDGGDCCEDNAIMNSSNDCEGNQRQF